MFGLFGSFARLLSIVIHSNAVEMHAGLSRLLRPLLNYCTCGSVKRKLLVLYTSRLSAYRCVQFGNIESSDVSFKS